MGPSIAAELADEALKVAWPGETHPRDARIIRTGRMLRAGFATTGTEPHHAVGTASQHPAPHSD